MAFIRLMAPVCLIGEQRGVLSGNGLEAPDHYTLFSLCNIRPQLCEPGRDGSAALPPWEFE